MATHLSFRQGVQGVSQHYWVMPVLVFHLVLWLRLKTFSILEIILLCLVIYAGAAQFIMCALFIAGTPDISDCTNCIYRKFKNVPFKYVACTKLQDIWVLEPCWIRFISN